MVWEPRSGCDAQADRSSCSRQQKEGRRHSGRRYSYGSSLRAGSIVAPTIRPSVDFFCVVCCVLKKCFFAQTRRSMATLASTIPVLTQQIQASRTAVLLPAHGTNPLVAFPRVENSSHLHPYPDAHLHRFPHRKPLRRASISSIGRSSVGGRRVRDYLVERWRLKARLNYRYGEGDVEWNPQNTLRYPAVCFFAGFFAGLFGVGGGIVKGPLMLEMGEEEERWEGDHCFVSGSGGL